MHADTLYKAVGHSAVGRSVTRRSGLITLNSLGFISV